MNQIDESPPNNLKKEINIWKSNYNSSDLQSVKSNEIKQTSRFLFESIQEKTENNIESIIYSKSNIYSILNKNIN